MIGWYIAVYQQTPAERLASHERSALLASWEAGVGGLAWLDKLVAEGTAECLSRGGYPSRYTARANDLLPLIVAGPLTPNHTLIIGANHGRQPQSWIGHLKVEQPKFDACPPEQILTVDAWDQS